MYVTTKTSLCAGVFGFIGMAAGMGGKAGAAVIAAMHGDSLRLQSGGLVVLYHAYAHGRRTLAELNLQYGRDVETLRRQFDRYEPKLVPPAAAAAPVALTLDATFFGRGYGLLVYRALGSNIHWQEIATERIVDIEVGLQTLLARSWQFSSVSIDGRRGVIQLIERLLPGVPVQMCLFHQKAIIRRYTTGNPKTDCGKDVRQLMHDMTNLNEQDFMARFQCPSRKFVKDIRSFQRSSGSLQPLTIGIRCALRAAPASRLAGSSC